LPGGGSLPEREWDRANGHKHKQVKSASKKMRFDVWFSLFFQRGGGGWQPYSRKSQNLLRKNVSVN
jgi:hypothetical protein